MTTLKYKTNLNCGSCVAAVKPYLDGDPAIRRWAVDTADPNKVLTVEGDDVSGEAVERDVASAGFKVLGKIEGAAPTHKTRHAADAAERKSFLATYRPLLLVFGYLLGLVALILQLYLIYSPRNGFRPGASDVRTTGRGGGAGLGHRTRCRGRTPRPPLPPG